MYIAFNKNLHHPSNQLREKGKGSSQGFKTVQTPAECNLSLLGSSIRSHPCSGFCCFIFLSGLIKVFNNKTTTTTTTKHYSSSISLSVDGHQQILGSSSEAKSY